MLEIEREKRTIDRLLTTLRPRYELLKEEKSSKTSEPSFVASGTKRGISGRRREKCGNVSGIKKGRGAIRRNSNGQGSSNGAGGSDGALSGKQGRPTRCNIWKETGHSGSNAPSGSVVSAARLATIPVPALRL